MFSWGLGCGQVPNGELTSKQLRFLGDQIVNLGEKGCADITTRANIQLRGMDLTDSAAIFEVRPLTAALSTICEITGHKVPA